MVCGRCDRCTLEAAVGVRCGVPTRAACQIAVIAAAGYASGVCVCVKLQLWTAQPPRVEGFGGWGGGGTLAAPMVWGSSSQLLSIWTEGHADDVTAVSLHGGCAVSHVEVPYLG
eukprot:328304-Chlamydomonas_euryale.AAC.1